MRTIYEENAFRILGVSANASWKTIRDTQQSLRIRAKVGGLGSLDDPLGFLNTVERTESSIREAFNKLENPRSRLHESLFWFSNNTRLDEQALNQLCTNNPKEAIKSWESAKSVTAAANLARLFHAQAVFKDPDANDTKLWFSAFRRWSAILENDEFWDNFADLETKSRFEPAASKGDLNALREESWSLVLDVSSHIIQEAVASCRDDLLHRYLNLIRGSGFPSASVVRLESQVFEPLMAAIKQSANTIGESLSGLDQQLFPEKICDKAYESFRGEILPRIARLTKLVGPESEELKEARATVASCLRNISISYHNEPVNDYQAAENLLKEAQSWGGEDITAEQIKDDLEVASKHAQQERVWGNLKPVETAPSLWTFNGIGAKLYGSLDDDYDEETNSYLSTLYFVILFIPIFPIARYRVVDVGDNAYRFIGKAPLRNLDKGHIALVLILAIIFLATVSSSNHSNYSIPANSSRYPEQTSNTPSVPTSTTPSNHDLTDQSEVDALIPKEIAPPRGEDLKEQIEAARGHLNYMQVELQQLKEKVELYESEIDLYASKIKSFEEGDESIYTMSIEDYRSTIRLHNAKVQLHNSTLNEFNLRYAEYERLLKETNAKINLYNMGGR